MSTEFFNDQWRIPSNENQNKVSNYSMDFDGTNYVQIGPPPNNTFLQPSEAELNATGYSVSAWIKIDSSFASTGGIFANDGIPQTGIAYGLEFYISGSSRKPVIRKGDGTGRFSADVRAATSAETVPLNAWTHVAFVLPSATNTTWQIYINGVASTMTTTGSGGAVGYSPNYSGGIGRYRFEYFQGQIDQVTVFDYALSQDQVTQLGAEGYAFNFIPNDYIDLGDSDNFSFGNVTTDSPFSISAWVNMTDATSFVTIAKDATSNREYVIRTLTDDKLYFYLLDNVNGGYIGRISSGTVTSYQGTWIHTVYTYNGNSSSSGIKIYLNGSQVDNTNYQGGSYTAMSNTTTSLNIGRQEHGVGIYANGEISNAAILNTELTGSQVATLYNSGKPLADMSSFTSLQGWWKLDDTATFNSGTSVWSIPDDSSNSNTGTSVGMNASNLVASNINGELIANPMITSPKPIAYYQLGDQSVSTGPTSDYLVPNNSLSGYDFKFVKNNSSYTSGDSINIPGINKALAGATSMSMTFWVYLTPAVYPNGMMFRMDAGSGNIQVRFVRYGNSRGPVWLFSMSDGTNSSGPSGSTSTATRPNFYNSDFIATPTGGSNIWWNITCTWDGSNVKVYRNGQTQSSRWGTYTGIIPSNANATAFLGANAPGSSTGLFMDGRISNVAFWRNYSLTQSEAQEVYNNGAPLDLNNFSGSAPAAWYKLNASEIFNSTSTEWSVDNNAYPSVYKSSLDFNGSSNYIDCGDSDDLSFGNGTTDSPFSISAWINMTSNASVFRIVNKYDTNYEYQFDVLSGVLRFYVLNDPFTGYRGRTGSTLNTGQWYHVVATYSGVGGSAAQNGMELYVNGQNVISSASTFGSYTAMSNTTAPVYIGRVATTYSNGEISNASIFNTELTGLQVATLYNNGNPEASISHSPVSWWKLDNTTTGIQDSAGSNNGTNNGATEYAGFVNALGGESSGMDSSNLALSSLTKGTSGYSPYTLNLDSALPNTFNCGNDNSLQATTALTISVWVKFTSSSTVTRFGVVSRYDSNSNKNYELALNNNSSNERTLLFSSGSSSLASSTFVNRSEWTHIAATADSNGAAVYINGVASGTSSSFTINSVANADFRIGVSTFFNSFFPGQISNPAVWSGTALTSTQVAEIYNQGRPSNLHNFSGTAPTSWWQIGSNSSFNSSTWTCLDEIGTNNAVSSANMTNDDITNGPGYSASGLGTSSIDIKGDAPYSTANGLSENMDVLDRTTDIPS